jgi:hypothetical protein
MATDDEQFFVRLQPVDRSPEAVKIRDSTWLIGPYWSRFPKVAACFAGGSGRLDPARRLIFDNLVVSTSQLILSLELFGAHQPEA